MFEPRGKVPSPSHVPNARVRVSQFSGLLLRRPCRATRLSMLKPELWWKGVTARRDCQDIEHARCHSS